MLNLIAAANVILKLGIPTVCQTWGEFNANAANFDNFDF